VRSSIRHYSADKTLLKSAQKVLLLILFSRLISSELVKTTDIFFVGTEEYSLDADKNRG